MKATFDFIPAYCPSSGTKLFQPVDGSEGLKALSYILDDYHNGQAFTCDKCGLHFEKAQPKTQAQNKQSTADLEVKND